MTPQKIDWKAAFQSIFLHHNQLFPISFERPALLSPFTISSAILFFPTPSFEPHNNPDNSVSISMQLYEKTGRHYLLFLSFIRQYSSYIPTGIAIITAHLSKPIMLLGFLIIKKPQIYTKKATNNFPQNSLRFKNHSIMPSDLAKSPSAYSFFMLL